MLNNQIFDFFIHLQINLNQIGDPTIKVTACPGATRITRGVNPL
jgi:hypothetical protein